MQITQIRIAGFKSFVDPTDVPVEPGLTGIVGPNGCGKSNLLESLRWAMGASSARAMRGGEMDDLIFSGSADRPARETAEVTLVLDNSKRTAPPEFNASDTLEVLRRLKRGAGSTYKLNGRTVRGKDIQLLFADASTGANSPALVRQGQISELIGSKPQNRRRILEEAAGIAGLNTRRHEAELKLRGAETNLERLTEVSAEVERQLESLKRQARKARKYKALSEEIAALEAWAAHLKWLAARETVEATRAALGAGKADVLRLTREDALAETNRLQAGDKLPALREAESVASAKLGQARISLARLETERKAAADALARMESEIERLTSDMRREDDMLAEAEAALARTQDELGALPKDNPEANQALEADLQAALERARAQLEQRQAAADDIAGQLAEARAARKAASANAQAQRQRQAELIRQIEKLQAELSGIEADTALAEREADAEKAAADAELALHDAQRAIDNAEAGLVELSEIEQAARGPALEAEKALRALETEIAGLERLLRRSDEPTAPPVVERVRTQDGFERAVAAALGDDLQASTDASASVYWAGTGNDNAPALPAGARSLSEVTDAPEELGPRLAQCGIVSAMDGPRLAAQLKTGQRLVSVEGHLWRWDGFVRTPDAPVSAAERLEQQARLEAAQTDLGPAKTAHEAAAEALLDAQTTRQDAEAELKTMKAGLPEARKALDRTREAHQVTRQARERAGIRRESAETALDRATTDLKAVEAALALIDPVGERGDDTALEAALAEARVALTQARNTETEARGRLTDLTRDREKIESRRKALERDLATWQQREATSKTRREALQMRQDEARKALSAARTAPDKTDEQLEALQADVARFEDQRKTASDSLAEAEAAHREAESAARAATAAAAKAREAVAGASVKLETAEEQLADIQETARSQFGRTPEGLAPLARTGLDEEALATLSRGEAEKKADYLRRDRDQLGGVNMEAEAEAEELADRLGLQAGEKKDLTAAIAKLREGVDALNDEGRTRLLAAFETVNEHFKALFTALFRGGQAELRLVDADDPLAAGLEIFAQPPGKRLGTLQLMSGGEQALTAAALIFAVFLSNPAPICVLDEVDAPLDDANVDRFCRMLDEMRQRTDTRFVVITHNPVTMSRMDRLFGVTMREKGVSKLVSVDLEAAEELVAAE